MLDDLARRARQSIDVPWDEVREERVLKRTLEHAQAEGAPAEPRAAIRWWIPAAAVAVAAAVVVVVASGLFDAPEQTEREIARARAPERIQVHGAPTSPAPVETDPSRLLLSDGSVVALGPGAEVAVQRDTAERIALRHHDGEAAYEVPPRTNRAFSVVVGPVAISVEAAAFSVTVDDQVLIVAVDSGSVDITDRDRRLRLAAGEQARLLTSGHDDRPERSEPTGEEAPSVRRPRRRSSGEPTSADAAEAAPSKTVPSAEELMRRADEARRARKPAEATQALELLLKLHPDDARVPTAWFTLGRIERDRKRHAAAAKAFEGCVAASPKGPLAGDALAGAAQAWMAAGRRERAAELARRYLREFPGDLHAAAMHEIVR